MIEASLETLCIQRTVVRVRSVEDHFIIAVTQAVVARWWQFGLDLVVDLHHDQFIVSREFSEIGFGDGIEIGEIAEHKDQASGTDDPAQTNDGFASRTIVIVIVSSIVLLPGRVFDNALQYKEYRRLATAGRIQGPKIHDARIAALATFHAIDELWSADRDFNRFPALKVHNPLVR